MQIKYVLKHLICPSIILVIVIMIFAFMNQQQMDYLDSFLKIISALGPFIAAAITGGIAILVVKAQSEATLKAAKIQSEATISTMNKSLNNQQNDKRMETIHNTLSDVITNLYIIGRSGPEPDRLTLSAIAKLQIILGVNTKELRIRELLGELMRDFSNGDISNVSKIRLSLIDESFGLFSKIEEE